MKREFGRRNVAKERLSIISCYFCTTLQLHNLLCDWASELFKQTLRRCSRSYSL